MQMHRLRFRLLTAMGLPALGMASSCTAVPPPDDAVDERRDDQVLVVDEQAETYGWTPAQADHVWVPASNHCGTDGVREQACGKGCGSTGKSLTAYGAHSFVLPRPDGSGPTYAGNDPYFAGFDFDQPATDAYRGTMTGSAADQAGYCCYSRCAKLEVAAAPPVALPPNMVPTARCVPAPGDGTSVPARANPSCPNGVVLDGAPRPYMGGTDKKCCYLVAMPRPIQERHPRGRPMRVDGVSVLSEPRRDRQWLEAPLDGLPEPSPAQRVELAAAWLAEARLEHASVAAFAKLSLQLMALGAPPDLIDAAHRAARDEVAHARTAFTLASMFAGDAVGPTAVPAWASERGADLTTLLAETLADGCVGETVAAQEAALAAERVEQAGLRGALATIADDEHRHAELAWRIAAWCLRTGGAPARATVEAALARLRAEPATTCVAACCARGLEPYGILCAHERAALRARVVADVVIPCLEALLASIDTEARLSLS